MLQPCVARGDGDGRRKSAGRRDRAARASVGIPLEEVRDRARRPVAVTIDEPESTVRKRTLAGSGRLVNARPAHFERLHQGAPRSLMCGR